MTGKERSGSIIAEHTAGYYISGVQEYVDKLIRIFKEKDTDTIETIKYTINSCLRIPTLKKTEKSDASNVTEQDIKTANAK